MSTTITGGPAAAVQAARRYDVILDVAWNHTRPEIGRALTWQRHREPVPPRPHDGARHADHRPGGQVGRLRIAYADGGRDGLFVVDVRTGDIERIFDNGEWPEWADEDTTIVDLSD